jgi:hypothetical protein
MEAQALAMYGYNIHTITHHSITKTREESIRISISISLSIKEETKMPKVTYCKSVCPLFFFLLSSSSSSPSLSSCPFSTSTSFFVAAAVD